MDIDFSALAARIATEAGGLRGCVIVSRDGLVLGAHPAEGGEEMLRPAWLKFAGLGEVEKGFIEFAAELWVYVQRGPYAAFAISGPNARPGLILDEMEQILLSAEEARTRAPAPAAKPEPGAESPRSKPRTALHPETRPAPAGQTAETAPAPAIGEAASAGPPGGAAPVPSAAPKEPVAGKAPTPSPAESAPAPAPDASATQLEGEVDRVLLAQEFAQLLEESGYDDEEEA